MRILLLIFLTGLIATSASAQIFSCRDSQGMLHYSDNLQGLPEECLGQQQEVKPGGSDKLNFVPASPDSQGSGASFRQSVRAEESKLQEVKQQGQQLQSRAEKILASFQQASQQKRQATRRWSYDSRKIIKQADAEIEQAREERQQVLQELADSRLARQDKKRIEDLLEEVADK